MVVTIVAGARPNFMKIAPIIKAIQVEREKNTNIQFRLVHTGQHYDKKMSGDFFEQLGIPEPDSNLACGGGTQAEQTAAIMVKFEQELLQFPPTVVLVVGDVTSTMACTITAKKLLIPVVHVEAGIRSGDMTMPEEINRIVTDSICDHFFTTSEFADQHLLNTGVEKNRIHFVGNTMIDTLLYNLPKIQQPESWTQFNLQQGNYFLLTLHRPSNVDEVSNLKRILESVTSASKGIPIVFPVHPRTRAIIDKHQINTGKVNMIDPQGYLEFIYLVKNAKAIITDSGGITEEATVLHVPCLTMRTSTERLETITLGTNELIGDDMDLLSIYLNKIINGNWKKGTIPPYWDGNTSTRIVNILKELYQQN